MRRAPGPPWRPPRPLPPNGIDELFAAGSERRIDDRRLRLSTHRAGELHLPTGQLVAADPSSLDLDGRPFTATVAPGTYPVTISLATFADDAGHRRVCAARLDITDEPVARWELALRDGQDPLDLDFGEFFGFGVDAGMACFVDAEACEGLAEVWWDLDGLVEPRYTVGAGEMVAWSSGWVTAPTRRGSAATGPGSVACYVADMLLFSPESDDYDD